MLVFISKIVKDLGIKINNKIIHQSKMLKYFEEEYEIKKAEVKFRNLKTGEEISSKIENLVNEIKKFI